MLKNSLRVVVAVAACAFTFSLASHAEVSAGSKAVRPLITQKIDESKLVTLDGNVSVRQTAARDRGPVEESLRLNHIFITLKRTPEQQLALENFLARQQQKGAGEYHQWLTPQQFGDAFGTSPKDIAAVETWLQSKGFHINNVPHSGHYIDVAGDPQAIREAFHTDLHYYMIRGKKVFANVNSPRIPAALAPVIAGITGLRNGVLHPNFTKRDEVQLDPKTGAMKPVANGQPGPDFTSGAERVVFPQDEYRIYGELALLNQTTPVNGTGATVAVLEQADMAYGTVNGTTGAATGGDLANFRTLFAVPGTLSFYVFHGYGADTCTDPGPGTLGEDEFEATIDAEWANATAPSAKTIFMSCDDTTDDGIFTSMQAVIDNNLADSMSLSYGESEIYLESGDYAYLDGLYEAAAAQGQTIAISTGDGGSASADQFAASSSHGINVSGLATSPYILASGGTDFQDLYDADEGGKPVTTYWTATNSTPGYYSAKGYVPEAAWNDGCAASLLAKYKNNSNGATYCATQPSGYTGNGGGTGGFSTHYTAPAYQTGITGFTGTARAVPDVSLFAADTNSWDRGIMGCDSQDGGSAQCTTNFYVSGGTSFVAPQMAGLAALLRQSTGVRQGTLNYAIYALAKAQFTGSLATSCYASGQTSNTGVTVSTPGSTCTFNDVTTDNNDQYCLAGSTSCYVNAGKPAGVLSLGGTSSLSVAYSSAAGYDPATGIGSVNIANLVNNWKNAFSTNTTLTVTPAAVGPNGTFTLTATVAATVPNGSVYAGVTGTVTFKSGTTVIGMCTLSGGTCSTTAAASTVGATAGNYSITASYGGSNALPASVSSMHTVTIGNLLFTSTSHNFGQVQVGTKATTYGVQLTNMTGAAFPFSLTLGGVLQPNVVTSSPFTQVNNCGSSLAAGKSCEILFSFTPATTGPVSATWSLASTAADYFAPSNGGTLTGSGTSQGGVSITTAGHNFGTVPVGMTSPTYGVELSNSTTSAVTLTKGSVSSPFAAVTNCGTSLAAGSSCELEFTFTPTSTSTVQQVYTLSGSTMITVNGAALPNGGITLTGN